MTVNALLCFTSKSGYKQTNKHQNFQLLEDSRSQNGSLENPGHLQLNFLNSDDDTLPLKELYNKKSKITNEEFLKIQGLLTEAELTDTLLNFMKGASAPGIDGFTVNWLREFWPDLKLLVRLALNEMYDESELSKMCRLAII